MFADKNDMLRYKWAKLDERREYLNLYKTGQGMSDMWFQSTPTSISV